MTNKIRRASVRPSPLASIAGIVGIIGMLIFGITQISGSGGTFMIIWVLFGLGGIVYFILNLFSYSTSTKTNIPMTAGEVIEVISDEEEQKPGNLDFATKLRKLEALKKDGLISELEYDKKRADIMKEKW